MAEVREEAAEPTILVPRGMTRKEFLRLGGAGVAGAALLGTAGCGVFESGGKTGGGSHKFITRTLERVMNLGENRIEMRIERSAWVPRGLCFPHS